MARKERLLVVMGILFCGCLDSKRQADLRVAEIFGRTTAGGVGGKELPEPGVLGHDFGAVLAKGQRLRHTFILRNVSRKPVRILAASARTPCCSEVEDVAKTIPPSGEAGVTVVMLPGFESGNKDVAFDVRTDSEALATYQLWLSARLASVWEVTTPDKSNPPVPANREGRQTLRVVARGWRSEELAGVTIRATNSLSAEFVGDWADRTVSDGLPECARDVEVEIAGRAELGHKSGRISFVLPDGTIRPHVVHWEVVPLIRAAPAGIVVNPSEGRGEFHVILSTTDRPFRIKSIDNEFMKPRGYDFGRGPSLRHDFRLTLDLGKTIPRGSSDVRIETDHPDQPSVVVSVLVLPSDNRGGTVK